MVSLRRVEDHRRGYVFQNYVRNSVGQYDVLYRVVSGELWMVAGLAALELDPKKVAG
jgi:hypothetical protein